MSRSRRPSKQAKTREARIDKFVPQILAGKGMRDR